MRDIESVIKRVVDVPVSIIVEEPVVVAPEDDMHIIN